MRPAGVRAIHRPHDGGGGVRRGLEIEADIALLVRPRAISDEADAAKLRGVRQDLGERVPRFVNPGMVVPMPCPTFPAIEPDASNTIMASSLQGGTSGSLAWPVASPIAMAAAASEQGVS